MNLPVLITANITFDTASDRLVLGESAIVFSIEEESDGHWTWTMLSVDRPRLIVQRFQSRPERVFKSWLKPDA